jgi:GTPase
LNKVILLAAHVHAQSDDFWADVEETQALIDSCELICERTIIQKMPAALPSYFNAGKLSEVLSILETEHIYTVVTHHALSPSQHRNLSQALNCEVLDRTQIILEIFKRRATTREAKLEVEHARLSYLLPHTKLDFGTSNRQQGGAFRTRGAGEQAQQLKQRSLEKTLQKLNRQLQLIHQNSHNQSKRRQKKDVFTVAIIGYTNAGKSTLLNRLLALYGQNKKEVSAKNQVFESLNTAARHLSMDGRDMIFIDTVGFISDLPHHLMKAFHATLLSMQEADLILHVIDASSPHREHQAKVTLDTLKTLQCEHIERIDVYNKIDLMDEPIQGISAQSGLHIDALVSNITQIYDKARPNILIELPYQEQDTLQYIEDHHRFTLIKQVETGYRIRLHHLTQCPSRLMSYQLK